VQFEREVEARGDGRSEGQGKGGEGDEVSLMSKANRPDHQLELRSRSQKEEDDDHKDRSESRLDKLLLPPLRLEHCQYSQHLERNQSKQSQNAPSEDSPSSVPFREALSLAALLARIGSSSALVRLDGWYGLVTPISNMTRFDVGADGGPEKEVGEKSEKGKDGEESQSSPRILEVRRRDVHSTGDYNCSISFEHIDKLMRRVDVRLFVEAIARGGEGRNVTGRWGREKRLGQTVT
jgi:hypothetical protein